MDAPFHREATGALLVVPVKVDIGILLAFPVSGENVVLLQSGDEVFGLLFLHILNAKIM